MSANLNFKLLVSAIAAKLSAKAGRHLFAATKKNKRLSAMPKEEKLEFLAAKLRQPEWL